MNSVVYLPIDAKFPRDVYEKVLDAYETADTTIIDAANKELENTIKKMPIYPWQSDFKKTLEAINNSDVDVRNAKIIFMSNGLYQDAMQDLINFITARNDNVVIRPSLNKIAKILKVNEIGGDTATLSVSYDNNIKDKNVVVNIFDESDVIYSKEVPLSPNKETIDVGADVLRQAKKIALANENNLGATYFLSSQQKIPVVGITTFIDNNTQRLLTDSNYIEKALDKNIAKLKKRYPEKFTKEKALNRNLEEERNVLT